MLTRAGHAAGEIEPDAFRHAGGRLVVDEIDDPSAL